MSIYIFPLGYDVDGLPPLEFPALFPDKCNEVFFCTPDAFHIAIRYDSSEQVCDCDCVCVAFLRHIGVQTSSFWLFGRISLTVMMFM
jgi:hypothetical protein